MHALITPPIRRRNLVGFCGSKWGTLGPNSPVLRVEALREKHNPQMRSKLDQYATTKKSFMCSDMK